MAESTFTDGDETEHFAQRDYTKPYPVPVLRVVPTYPSVTERYFDVRFFIPLDYVATNKNAGDQCVLFHTNRLCIITLAPHHPLLPNNNFGLKSSSLTTVTTTESSSSTSTSTSSSSTINNDESNVNLFDPISWQSFINNTSKKTIESIDFTNGNELSINNSTANVNNAHDELTNDNLNDENHTTTTTTTTDTTNTTSSSSSSSQCLEKKSNIQLINAQKHNRLLNCVSGKRKKGGQKLKERSIICSVKCTDGSTYCILSGVRGTLVEINEALLTSPNLLIEEPWSRGFVAIIMTRITRTNRLKDILTSSDDYYKLVSERKAKSLITSVNTNDHNLSNKSNEQNDQHQLVNDSLSKDTTCDLNDETTENEIKKLKMI